MRPGPGMISANVIRIELSDWFIFVCGGGGDARVEVVEVDRGEELEFSAERCVLGLL